MSEKGDGFFSSLGRKLFGGGKQRRHGAEGKTAGRDRVIRVFISSTFRDMQEERELLVKEGFPELRRICWESGVDLTEVDLRWGVADEQVDRFEVLHICLAEIYRRLNLKPAYLDSLMGRSASLRKIDWVGDALEMLEEAELVAATIQDRTE